MQGDGPRSIQRHFQNLLLCLALCSVLCTSDVQPCHIIPLRQMPFHVESPYMSNVPTCKVSLHSKFMSLHVTCPSMQNAPHFKFPFLCQMLFMSNALPCQMPLHAKCPPCQMLISCQMPSPMPNPPLYQKPLHAKCSSMPNAHPCQMPPLCQMPHPDSDEQLTE